MGYFEDLFKSGSPAHVECCINTILGRILAEMNTKLEAPFGEAKIMEALNQMAAFKAPSPDGFTADFYQKNWSTIGPEVCRVALHFFNTAKMDEKVNVTHIALIPKKSDQSNVSDFKPISLCNVTYKIISKVFTNRLKRARIPQIIPGRLITDNILATYETLHTMHSRMWSKVGFMGIKLDISKAYD